MRRVITAPLLSMPMIPATFRLLERQRLRKHDAQPSSRKHVP
jgi:hypothetical protein